MRSGRLGLVISEVVGHGIGPALVMAATRTCARSLAVAMVAAIHRAAREFCDLGTLRDDTTSLVLKVVGVNGTGGSRLSPPSAT